MRGSYADSVFILGIVAGMVLTLLGFFLMLLMSTKDEEQIDRRISDLL
jgi:hypothetical protein